MRRTETTYICDGCGKVQKELRSLRKFGIVHYGRGRASYDSPCADLCDACEARLIAAVEPIMGSDVLALRREPNQTSKPPRKVTAA